MVRDPKNNFREAKQMSDATIELKVDVEVLKNQILTITQLCGKMDSVIEKLVDNHDRMVNQIYTDMEKRKNDTNTDIKELHSRITTISREVSDKVELTERRIMDEIKSLRDDIAVQNKKKENDLQKILQWKWMVAGGMVVLAWVISNVNLTALSKVFN
jgi:formyltetrahydrofolate hydrolase